MNRYLFPSFKRPTIYSKQWIAGSRVHHRYLDRLGTVISAHIFDQDETDNEYKILWDGQSKPFDYTYAPFVLENAHE